MAAGMILNPCVDFEDFLIQDDDRMAISISPSTCLADNTWSIFVGFMIWSKMSSRHRMFLQFFINSVFHSENTYFDQWHEVNLMKFEINKTQCHVICLLGLHLVYSFRTEHAVRLCFWGRIVYISTMVNDRFSWSNYISVCWGTLKRCNAYRNLLFLHLQGSP